MSVTAKGRDWEILHSLWIGWTFTLGLFNWIAFIYIGIRAKQWKWILWGVLYLVPIIVVILLSAADASAALGVPAVLLTFGVGVASIFHAFRVRGGYLRRLEALKGGDATTDPALRSSPSALSRERSPKPHRSWWVGWTFVPVLNWVAFVYVGIRAKQRKWIFWGVVYLVPWMIPGFNNTIVQWLTGILALAAWIASIAHAFLIRQEYQMRLGTLPGTANEVETAPSGETSGPANASVPARTHTQEHSPRPTSEEPDASSDQSPEDSPSQEPVPPLVAVDDSPRKVVPERLGTTSIPTNYPLPLAYSYRLADAEFETFRVLKELYRNAEGLTAFLASLALVLAPTPTGKRKDTLLWAWRGKGATFGSWYAILEKTTPTIEEDKGHLYRSMQQLLGTKANPSSFAETMTWLIDRRNDLHHGDLPVGPRADLLIQEVRSRFEHCASESAALWQHPLRLVLDYDAVRNKDYVVATCLDFSGDHPVGRKVQERYQGIPKKQDLYILQDGKQWISLYPFISVHYCPHCNARETYYVDAWQGTGEEANLRSFERSHEEVSEEIGQELTLRLGS